MFLSFGFNHKKFQLKKIYEFKYLPQDKVELVN
jgi:hypothetical protein